MNPTCRPLRRALAVLASAAAVAASLLVATPATAAVPGVGDFGPVIDPYPRYVAETTCSPTEKPGTQHVRSLILQTYGSAWTNIVRPCSSANSGHEEGRALDWSRRVDVPAERAQVQELLNWLLATDQYGNKHAMARRMGVSYLMWDGKIWGTYAADRGWQPQSSGSCHLSTSNKTTCHRDHLHISLAWEGAQARTSLYTGPAPACLSGPGCPVSRLGGADRFATSAAIARQARPTGTTVVLANGDDAHLVDGLVAGPLASARAAPVLLVTASVVPASVRAELARRRATTAVLVGGEGALGPGVVTQLRALGITSITRAAGADRFATAAAVAQLVGGTRAVVASGRDVNLVDALAVGGPAARTGTPILLTSRTTVPAATAAALQGRTSTVVVGGTGAVPAEVVAQLPSAVRLGGTDRYATAAAVAQHYKGAVGAADVLLAAGTEGNLVDSLPGAAFGRLILLTRPTVLPASTSGFITPANGVRSATALGGTGAVSDGVLASVSARLGG